MNFVCTRLKLRPDASAVVEGWQREMSGRLDELRATLAPEGIELEIVFLEHASDGDYLLFVMKTDDLTRARDVFAASDAAIDNYHRAFMNENVLGIERLDLMYAVRA